MKILKRDKQLADLDISKIVKQTTPACEGLDLSHEELEIEANISFTDGMKSEDIQQILINTAKGKVDVDVPNWTFVAARLTLYDLYHRIRRLYNAKSTVQVYNDVPLISYLNQNLNILDFDDYSKFQLKALEEAIIPTRDYKFNSPGIETLISRYLIKDSNSNTTELPQHMFMCLAMWLAKNEDNPTKRAIEFYNVLSKLEALPGTPTLSNGRLKGRSCFSCFVGSSPDNLTGIFKAYGEQAEISKEGGGIGWDWTKVRALGGPVQNVPNASGGIVPWLKIENDIAIAVDQLGTRSGAINCSVEIWHKDFPDFLDLKKTSGEERRRAEDLFTTASIPDLFMKRCEEDGDWTLFDPYDTNSLQRPLYDLWGEEFEDAYISLEIALRESPSYFKNTPTVVKAKDLMKKLITYYFERGTPFITFKDTVNRGHQNPELGIIRSGNLCQEFFNPVDEHEIAVCNLASINLSKVNTFEDMQRVIPTIVRMLDNVIDLSSYPVQKAKDTQLTRRSIGLGVCGEAELIANNYIHYGSTQHLIFIDELYNNMNMITNKASLHLGRERGSWNNNHLDYRNAYKMCIAPTSSIAILMGTSSSCEPVFAKKWFEENMDGNIPFTAPNINAENYQYYVSAYDVDQLKMITATGIRQKYFDMGISHNMYFRPENITIGKIYKTIHHAWKSGLKSLYYLRSESAKIEEVKSQDIACFGCEG